MAKHLTKDNIEVIVSLIDGWDGKLGWESLCAEVAVVVGSKPTRQTLSSHEAIKSAFDHQKDRLRSGASVRKRPPSLDIAAQRIRDLEAQNSRLRLENDRLLERFARWEYNAYKHGKMPLEQLDAPLPRVDRHSAEKS
ncbi:hypothetical protein NJC38_24090 [Pseudomonas sp. 21LCFQ010]|uniref:hypothetical protein n=1 Tax=Pseudomonas sp. 21LCFQ010 TaxID=2957506 RepID=UPI002098014A|nr:hypothetical protein [Pseudomonas sp. 21LCFQ010]MCO8165223.1 hypothetical protein [Pseudomonas sp. 21LCFQ010]